RGGDGGGAWGGNVYSAKFFAATNCTFSDGGAVGGGAGHAGSGAFSGRDGVKGVSRGGNMANLKGMFLLKNCLIAFPVSGTNVSRTSSILTVTNITDTGTNIITTNIVSSVTNFVAGGNGYGSFLDSGFNLSSDR